MINIYTPMMSCALRCAYVCRGLGRNISAELGRYIQGLQLEMFADLICNIRKETGGKTREKNKVNKDK